MNFVLVGGTTWCNPTESTTTLFNYIIDNDSVDLKYDVLCL